MDHGELKTHLWNLSFVAVASTVMGACGPFVPIDDTGPGYTETDIGPNTTTVGGQCSNAQDCRPDQACVAGICIANYGDTDYGDTDYYDTDYYSDSDYYDTCGYYCTDTDTDTSWDTDTSPVECYQHVDCGDGRVCNSDGLCDYAQALEPCPAPFVAPLSLPTMSADALVSLSFVDVDQNPWQDLVVGRSGSAELLLGPGDGAPIELPVPPGSTVVDAIAGDFDADGQADLVLATQAGVVLVLVADGAGGYVLTSSTVELGSVLDLAPLHFNLDGTLDLALRVEGGGARVYWGDGGGGFSDMYSLQAGRPVTSLVSGDLEGDADDDLVVQDPGGAKRFEGTNSGNLVDDGLLPGGNSPRGLLSGYIGQAPRSDVVGYTLAPESTLLELWPDAQDPQYYAVAGAAKLWAGLGDVDADGTLDVVLAGPSSIDYVSASSDGVPSLACVATYEYPSSAIAMAVGDLDGNLRADVALGDAQGVTVLLTQ